jgi:biotin operon repressor
MTTINTSFYAQVKGELIFNTKLSDGAFRFICRIIYLAGENDCCWHSQAVLAKELECSERTIRTRRKECEEAGILRVQHRFQDTNKYYPLVRVIPQQPELSTPNYPPVAARQVAAVPVRQHTANKLHAPNNNHFKRASSPVKKFQELPTDKKFAKTAAFLAGEKVQWSIT